MGKLLWALLEKQRPSDGLTGNLYGAEPFLALIHRLADAATAVGMLLAVAAILYHYTRNRKGAFRPFKGAVTFVAAYVLFVGLHHAYLSVEFYTPDFTVNTFARIVRAVGALVLGVWLFRYLPVAVRLAKEHQTAEQLEAEKQGFTLYRIEAERRKAALEAVSDATFTVGAAGNFRTDDDVSGWVRLTGRPASEVTGFAWREDIHPDDIERVNNEWAAVAASKTRIRLRFRVNHRTLGVRYVVGGVIPVADDATGEIMEWVAAYVDETEQVMMEQQLALSLAETRAIVDSALDSIVITDEKGVLLDFNSAAERCFGYAKDRAVGRDMSELLIPPDLRPAHRAGMLRYLATGDSRILNKRMTVRAMRSDGTTFPAELAITKQVAPAGDVRFVAVMRDITDSERTEEERLVALQDAQSAARAKSDFLAVMSHELRTPLTAIIGYSELLETEVYGPLTDIQTEPLARVIASAKHLVNLIDQVLDFSAIEAGKVRVTPEVVNLQKLLQGCCDIVAPVAQDKSISIQCKCDPLLMVVTDNSRLQQVVLNLLTNAVKFTNHGSVKVDAFVKGKMVSISVEDTGVGISEEYQDKIFEKFWQLKQGRTRETGGAGLGLAITKKLVTSLMGDIMVQSQEGLGTTFTVMLPLEMGQP